MRAKGLRGGVRSPREQTSGKGSRRVGSTRRLPVAFGAAALAVAALGACSAGGAAAGSASDSKSVPIGGSSSTVSPAPPGKYQTLPAPCTAVDQKVLKLMVPAARDFAGAESLTYDTDRRVGCSWQGSTSDGTANRLSVDLERVVSYDPAVSAEVQAGLDFQQQAATAAIPQATATPTSSPASTAAGGTGADGTAPDLAPRRLADLGDTAFIDDVPKGHPTASHRVVTIVFRTANVLVTVSYSQSSAPGGAQPQSADLQKSAQLVADELERKIEH